MKKQTKIIWNVGLIAALLLLLFILEQVVPSSSMLFMVLKKGAIYALVAVSMNLLNGFTGLFSLGQAGFMLLGAYTYAILTIPVESRASVYQYFDGGLIQFSLPELLGQYLDLRREERTGWTSKGQLKGTVNDFNKVMVAIRYLREKELSTVESLDAYLDTVSGQAVSIRAEMKPKEKRMKEVDTMLSHIANFEAHKPVHAEYAAIRFKKPKEQFAAAHRDELDAYNAAVRYFKVHLEGTKYSTKKLNEERTQLAGEVAEYKERLSAVQEDVKILRDVRHWLNQVLPSEQYRQTAEPGKKPSIQQAVKGRAQRIREEQAEKRQQSRTEKKQDMEL